MLLFFAEDGRGTVAGPFNSWKCCASVKSGDVASEEAVVVVVLVATKFMVVAAVVMVVEVVIED